MKIKVGDYARHSDHPNYGWAKVLEIIPPKTGVNKKTYKIARVEWTVYKNDTMGLIKYFKVRDLIRGK